MPSIPQSYDCGSEEIAASQLPGKRDRRQYKYYTLQKFIFFKIPPALKGQDIVLLYLLPFQGGGVPVKLPRALPWAVMRRPFRAKS